MTTPHPAPQRYVLKPQPPLRAFLISAILLLLGAILLSSTSGGGSVVWVALSWIVLLLGLALAGMAGWSMVTMRTFVDLDDDGYRITGPGADKAGRWDEVTKVTTSGEGAHLTLYHGQTNRTHILCPGGAADAEMTRLVTDVAQHLDANRGYGETMNVPLINPHEPPNSDVVSHG
ncbi:MULTISPECIES: hypothetical protein [unclassified Luteococcus]|uniref:hypothetical protein n=1 Tax=unclassified Luteococcus TaxID=2639923 RepID=UPI00313D4833